MTTYALDPTEALAWSIDTETDEFDADEDILYVSVPDSIPEEAVVEAYERACDEFSDRDDPEPILEQLLLLLPQAERVNRS